jgi:ROK family
VRDLASQRELSRLRVIEALFRRPGSSRTQVGVDAGLSRPTVAAVLEELEGAGILEQSPAPEDERSRPAGRPPMQVRIAPRAAFAVGLDFGHRHIRAALCDLSGHPVADDWSEAEVDSAPAASLDLAHELVRGLLERAQADRADVIGVGMGLAAPVDAESGTAYVERILPGWGGVRPAAEMEARLGLRVKLENDANVGALGEHRFGAARGARDVAYVRLSAGIGLGLILGGVPYRGRLGIAGELGHVRAVENGALCRCGNRGCLETVAAPRRSPMRSGCTCRASSSWSTRATPARCARWRRPARRPGSRSPRSSTCSTRSSSSSAASSRARGRCCSTSCARRSSGR